MNRITFAIAIQASREQIWRSMLADATYRQWCSAFQEGSYAVTDWQPGSKALFLTPSGNGMVSKIIAHRPNEFLSIQHLGFVKNGVEDTRSAEETGFAGALENYSLSGTDGSSTLTIEMDVVDEYKSYFEETWPKALAKLKQLSETR